MDRPRPISTNGKYLRSSIFLIFLGAVFPGEAGHAQNSLSSEEIYRRVSPSGALIQGSQSIGSGVVVRQDGLILTNLHVVSSQLTFSVTVSVLESGKVVTKTYTDLPVWKVHSKYDLALIKIDDSRVRFTPATILPKNVPLQTGSVCYALGNPGGAIGSFEQSITEGIVSASNRQVMGLDYIQVSAALNPGNSGGAIVDAKARVIGIATWKLSQADNMGFAIPLRGVDMRDFVDPAAPDRATSKNSAPPAASVPITKSKGPISAPFPSIVASKASVDALLEAARGRAKTAVDIPPTGLVKPLPGRPNEVMMGYAGTCLLMRFPDLKRLGVFDLCEAKFIKYIDLEDPESIFAAGGKVLLIYSPAQNQIQKWNMEAWTPEGVKQLTPEERFTAIGMGLLNPSFALVVRGEISGMENTKLAIFTPSDGRFRSVNCVEAPTDGGLPLGHFFGHMSDRSQARIEETGAAAIVTGGGRGYLNLANPVSVPTSYIHLGGLVEADILLGGSHVIIGHRGVYGAEDEKDLLENDSTSADRIALASVAGFRGFVEISRKEEACLLQLRAVPQLNEVFTAPLDAKIAEIPRSSDGPSLFASAYVGRCALVDRDAKTITLLPIVKKVDASYTGAPAPGGRFTRKIFPGEGTVVKIDSGPPGLIYDEKAGELQWDIPKTQLRGTEVSVILLLTDAKGAESYQVEKIVIP